MNLSGKWIGEFSQLAGTIQPIPISYFSFEIEIVDNDGEIEGKGVDQLEEEEPFTIKGFYQDGMISFIKKYTRFLFQDEQGDIFADDDSKSDEVNYLGSFNSKEEVFEGTWEIKVSEEREGLQEVFIEEHEQGKWYFKKV